MQRAPWGAAEDGNRQRTGREHPLQPQPEPGPAASSGFGLESPGLLTAPSSSQDSGADWGFANWISLEQPAANPSSSSEAACCLRHNHCLSASKFSCSAIFISCTKLLGFFFFRGRNILIEENQIKYSPAVLPSRKY